MFSVRPFDVSRCQEHGFLDLCRLPELRWCHARAGFEEANEMLRILEAQALAHAAYAQRVVCQQLLGSPQQAVVDEVLGITARLGLHQFAEISR